MNGDVHICRGTNRRYQARVRLRGHRKYWLVGQPQRSQRKAARLLMSAFVEGPFYKRGDILLLADYYEPVSIFEVVRP